MLESLSGDAEGSSVATAESNRQKLAAVSQALLEQHTYSTLVQCYNAAYYFLTASTAPTTVPAEQRVAADKTGTVTTTAMAITPAGKLFESNYSFLCWSSQ